MKDHDALTVRDVAYRDDLARNMGPGSLMEQAENTELSDQAFRLLARLHKEANERAKLSRVPNPVQGKVADFDALSLAGLVLLSLEGQETRAYLVWN